MNATENLKLMQLVITEAWGNPAFKQELIDSPIESIQKLTGRTIQLPEGVESIQVVDQSDSAYTFINIPAKKNLDDMELTDNELEIVSGGTDVRQRYEIKLPDFGPFINR